MGRSRGVPAGRRRRRRHRRAAGGRSAAGGSLVSMVHTGRVAAWGPLLRIARRDALRARGRSALIVAMILLPVLGLTVADVMLRSGQLDPYENVTRQLGGTQARVSFAGAQLD